MLPQLDLTLIRPAALLDFGGAGAGASLGLSSLGVGTGSDFLGLGVGVGDSDAFDDCSTKLLTKN